jgi:acylphosphatase
VKTLKPPKTQDLQVAQHPKVKGMKVRAHLLVSGSVQGVFFRSQTQRRAESLDVKGWVRNLPDGRVEAVFEGDEEAVKALIKFCEHGPSGAMVTNVNLKWESYIGEFKGFKITY